MNATDTLLDISFNSNILLSFIPGAQKYRMLWTDSHSSTSYLMPINSVVGWITFVVQQFFLFLPLLMDFIAFFIRP